jgi:hypothetical protein
MAGLRFTELQSRPMEFLDFISLTLEEFQRFCCNFHLRQFAVCSSVMTNRVV